MRLGSLPAGLASTSRGSTHPTEVRSSRLDRLLEQSSEAGERYVDRVIALDAIRRLPAEVPVCAGVAEDFDGPTREALDVGEPAEPPVLSVLDHLPPRRHVRRQDRATAGQRVIQPTSKQ